MSFGSTPSMDLERVIFMHETYRLDFTVSKPSSSGSKTSINSTLLRELTWWSGIFRFRISAMVTALLMARPIAFSTILSDPSVWKTWNRFYEKQPNQGKFSQECKKIRTKIFIA